MSPEFGFHRGSVALDFAGTVSRRTSQPHDRLPDPSALGRWLHDAGLIPVVEHPRLSDLHVARALREAIARVAAAVVARATPDAQDIAAIDDAARWQALAVPFLDQRTLTARWLGEDQVRAALGRVAADAIDVFAHRRDRIVRCELPGCGALLLSSSRGPRRRWCSMETCGNTAKVAAHRARAKLA